MNRFIQGGVAGLATPTQVGAPLEHAGWRRMVVRPAPAAVRTLFSARASRDTPLGYAAVSWARPVAESELLLELNVTVPHSGTASVEVPLLLEDAASWGQNAVHVMGSSCVLRCVGDLGGPAAVVGGCDTILGGAQAALECRVRSDGERVLSMQLTGGKFPLRVMKKS